jgi:phosphatidylglycerol:prolipoprotein diacylglycerol transferase
VNPPRSVAILGFPVYLYGILIALGFGLAVWYVYRRRREFSLTTDNVLDIFLCAVLGGLVGARLYYVAFSAQDFFGPGKWLNIFKVREGGLAVYGGIIGGVAAAYIYSRLKKVRFLPLLDAGAFGLLIGQSVGRWGNFFNREAFGGETAVPWRMGLIYPGIDEPFFVHPTFLYESLWNAAGFLLLHIFSKRRREKFEGQLFLLYLLWYGVGRAFIEGLRADSLYIPGTALRVSQLLSIALILLSAAVLLARRKRMKNNVEQGE